MNKTTTLQKTGIAGVILFGLTTFITASLLSTSLIPLTALAVSSSVGEEITAITYNFDTTPGNINFNSVDINSPNKMFYAYFVNPLTPPQDPATTAVVAHDGRYSGGFQVTLQADDFINTKDPRITLAAKNLSVVTSNNSFTDVVKPGTPAVTAPLDGNPAMGSPDYDLPGHAFGGALVIIDGSTADCTQGRVGTYTTYPSYRLHIPNDTPSGQYPSIVTYTMVPAPGNC